MAASTNINKVVGGNVQRLRKARDMSQTELAVRMTERGHPWHQQTVLRLEKGTRPLKLDEALDLADVLDVLTELLWEERPVFDAAAVVTSATHRFTSAWNALDDAAYELERCRYDVIRAVAVAGKTAPKPLLSRARSLAELDALAVVRKAMARLSLEHAAEQSFEGVVMHGPGHADG